MNYLALAWLASEAYEPDNAVGLIGLLITNAPGLAAAVFSGITYYHHRKAAPKLGRIEANTKATVAQVVNNHEDKPVLRSDIDHIIAVVTPLATLPTAVAELRGEVKGLTHRVDQLTER